jgi:hypothetical protein
MGWVRTLEGPVSQSAGHPEPAPVRRRPDIGHVDRAIVAGRADVLGAAGLSSLQASGGNAAVGRLVALPSPTSARFGAAYGASLDHVRVHVDSPVPEAHGAHALTVGSDVAFAPGRYRPDTEGGQRLIGHELAHVVQQQGGSVGVQAFGGPATDAHEREADAAARAALSGEPVPALSPVTAPARQRGGKGAAASAGDRPLLRYRSEDPLAAYTVFKAASPAGYTALDATAKQRAWRPDGDSVEPAPGKDSRTQTEVPVVGLLRPKLPPVGALAALRDRLWPLLTAGEQDTRAIAVAVRDEVMSRWAMRNDFVLSAKAVVRLIEPSDVRSRLTPEGFVDMGPDEVLEFTIDGRLIQTRDGSVDLVTLDLLGSNDLETAVGEVSGEAAVMAQAADLIRVTADLVEAEGRFWDEVDGNPDAFAVNDVQQHFDLLWESIVIATDASGSLSAQPGTSWASRIREFLAAHPEHEADLAGSLDRLSTLAMRALPIQQSHAERHDMSSMPMEGLHGMRDNQDDLLKRAGESWDEGGEMAFVAVCEYLGWGLSQAILGFGNLVTGGGVEAGYQAERAYREGRISKTQLDELDAAIAGRGAVCGLVFAALTLATAGLAGPVLGTAAGLGRTMAYAGVSEALTTGATMTTGSIYTRQQDFADPTAQNIWRQGAYSPGEIAIGSLTAGAFAAALPLAGMAITKLVSWIRATRPGPTLALALRQADMVGPPPPARTAGTGAAAELPPPTGWVAEEVSPGFVRYTNPNVPGEIIVTPTGFRYQTPTGTGGMHVEFDLSMSPTAAGQDLLPGGQLALPPGARPFGPTPQAAARASQRLYEVARFGGDLPQETRAVGSAIIEIEGWSGQSELRAISSAQTDALGAGAPVVHAPTPTERTLPAVRMIGGTGGGSPVSHVNDAEIKLYELLKAELKRSGLPRDTRGTIYIATWRSRAGGTDFAPLPMCAGCTNASFHMVGEYPGIDIVSMTPPRPATRIIDLDAPSPIDPD